MSTPPPSSPAQADMHTLLPLGGIVMAVGALGDDWTFALDEGAEPFGRIIPIAAEEAQGEGLDLAAEREKLLDLHLIVIGPDINAARILSRSRRMIEIFEPVVALLGYQAAPRSLLDDLGYELHQLPSGLWTLLPDEGDGTT